MSGGPGAEKVEKMFDSIASDYDRLNHLLSLGVDRIWRKRALKHIVTPDTPQAILDIACGTGDFSIDISRRANSSTTVSGIDLSEGMLTVMKRKVEKANLSDRIKMYHGDCEKMEFPDSTFDRVTIAFGIRNFEHREEALREILRVLKPDGRVVILELSIPEIPLIRGLYKLYFLYLLPLIGGMVSGDKAAYRYLPTSVAAFPKKKEWMTTMSACGYRNVTHTALSLGICRMYVGEK